MEKTEFLIPRGDQKAVLEIEREETLVLEKARLSGQAIASGRK